MDGNGQEAGRSEEVFGVFWRWSGGKQQLEVTAVSHRGLEETEEAAAQGRQ